jgi:predicted MFS family arabinose efflux permease
MMGRMVSLGRYGLLARTSGFWVTALSAFVARLPAGMTGLALVLDTTAHGGSYAAAGAISASCAAAGAISAPLRGRATDRVGPGPTLVGLALLEAAAMIAFTLASATGAPLLLRCVLGAAAGAVVPPVGAMMRVIWQRLIDEGDLLDAVFALESVVFNVVYLVGLLLVAAIMLLRSADLALLLMAVMTIVGSTALARTPGARAWPTAGEERDWLGPLRTPGVLLLLPITLLSMAAVGACEIGAVAAAGEHGFPAAAGILIAGTSAGSIAGGLYWGSRRQPGSPAAQQVVLLVLLGCGLTASALAPGLPGIGLALGATGLVLAPMLTNRFGLMQRAAPAGTLAEAFSWLNSLGGAGAALGAGAAGLVANHAHSPAAFLLAAALAGLAALLALPLATAERRP